jgi:hypothetical protein
MVLPGNSTLFEGVGNGSSPVHGLPPVLLAPVLETFLQSSRPLLWHMAVSCRSPAGPHVHPHEVMQDTGSLQQPEFTQNCSALHGNCRQSF